MYAPPYLFHTLQVDPKIAEGKDDREGLLDRAQAIERPLAVDWYDQS